MQKTAKDTQYSYLILKNSLGTLRTKNMKKYSKTSGTTQRALAAR